MRIKFYALSSVSDALIRFAVIVSRAEGKWVLCRHKKRDTWEIPGGHREYEEGGESFCETALEAAERELREETGAVVYQIRPVCIYSVVRGEVQAEEESLGLLTYAEIEEFGNIESEIGRIELFESLPERNAMTYPDIQPFLNERVQKVLTAEQRLSGVKAVILDLDRTLLRTDKTISDYSVSVLEECRRRGIRLVFATARPFRTVKPYLVQVPCEAVICHNGAFVMCGEQRIGEPCLVDGQKAARLLRQLNRKDPGRKLSVEIQDTLYANFDGKEFWKETEGVISDFTDLPRQDVDKILIEVSGEEECEALKPLLWDGVYGQLSDGRLCLVMNKNATKMNALKQLSEYWGIPVSNMLAFGDDRNDLEMLIGCGVGAAVANALEEVRDAADLLVDSNDEDGVACFLELMLRNVTV